MPTGQGHWAEILSGSTGPGTSFFLLLMGSYLNAKLQVNVIRSSKQLPSEKCLSQSNTPKKTPNERSIFFFL